MPAIVRLGDMSTGDPCGAPARPNNQGCVKTFSDGLPIHCGTMSWVPHACPKSPPHGAVTNSSSICTAEGKPIAKVGDPISCGSSCAQGSPLNTTT